MRKPHLPLLWFLLCIAGCCAHRPLPGAGLPLDTERSRWFLSAQQPALGAVLLVHGLNQRPSSLDELASYTASLGFDVYRLSLSGHDESAGGEQNCTPDVDWPQDITLGLDAVAKRDPNLPVNLIGYSLGGLLVVNHLNHHPENDPRTVTLFAPPISLRPFSHLARLSAIAPGDLQIPSFAPPDYARHRTVPVSWYRYLMQLFDQVADPPSSALRQSAGLIMVSPRDELVSPTGIREWISEKKLEHAWRFEAVDPHPFNPKTPEHLIIDMRATGRKEWDRITQLLAEHLLRPRQLPIRNP